MDYLIPWRAKRRIADLEAALRERDRQHALDAERIRLLEARNAPRSKPRIALRDGRWVVQHAGDHRGTYRATRFADALNRARVPEFFTKAPVRNLTTEERQRLWIEEMARQGRIGLVRQNR